MAKNFQNMKKALENAEGKYLAEKQVYSQQEIQNSNQIW